MVKPKSFSPYHLHFGNEQKYKICDFRRMPLGYPSSPQQGSYRPKFIKKKKKTAVSISSMKFCVYQAYKLILYHLVRINEHSNLYHIVEG